MVLVALSHGLLTYTDHLQGMVFVLPPGLNLRVAPRVVVELEHLKINEKFTSVKGE